MTYFWFFLAVYYLLIYFRFCMPSKSTQRLKICADNCEGVYGGGATYWYPDNAYSCVYISTVELHCILAFHTSVTSVHYVVGSLSHCKFPPFHSCHLFCFFHLPFPSHLSPILHSPLHFHSIPATRSCHLSLYLYSLPSVSLHWVRRTVLWYCGSGIRKWPVSRTTTKRFKSRLYRYFI